MKKNKLILLLLFILVHASAKAQLWPYSLVTVPEVIKNKASIITHLENINVEAESDDKITISIHKIFTVVNEDGKGDLLFTAFTSKYVSLEDAEIKVYDAAGKQTGKYKKKDMSTAATGEGLIEDGYVTYFRISTSSYPVTLDIKYEQRVKSTLSFPDYRFISPREGIVESNYTIRAPAEIGLRYKAKNTTIQPVLTDEGKYKVYKWSVKNLSPIEYEEGAVSSSDRYPHIMIVSDKFSHYGFKGDLSSWKSFGAWIKSLYEGLDFLPADRQQFFLSLTKDTPDEKEKIKRIYNYMQENFRYVSIQLGIGGLRPFSADFTDKKKYGDCKALSNYMKAALKSIGIKSHVAIINAEYNQEPVDPDFPANEFNHVILCIPEPKDSIWLECTSSTAEFGELGTFTENRNALLITEDGGVLVPTPKSHSSTNILSTITTVTIADDLSGVMETIFNTRGNFLETVNDILKESKDHQKEALVFYFGFKQPDDFVLTKEDSPGGRRAKLKMAVSKVPEFNAGEKLFISPRMYKMWSTTLPKAENRKFDFYFRFPFEKNDTTIFKLPAGIKPDALPKENEFNSPYASYHSKYWYKESENSIYSATTFILKQHKVLAADYASVKKFFGDIAQDNSQKIVVLKSAIDKKGF
jgi:Domain of Unknown Function with PDB structure (DUF3857)/Transglutaminase-like superfamily